ncbi:PAS domain-containing protein [Haloplanus halophilus]|uniref:PAS domain-containing protein n=1 Tax=Haloplanus halophilus TaxID=2949993 RepID=UPI002041CCDA|nr:PAS domain-containing protein [Haloplanus sp. GDY1]
MDGSDSVSAGDGVSDAVKRRALAAAPLGVVVTDPTAADNPIVYANEAFYRLTGYDPEAVLGSNCRFLQGPETDPERVAELRAGIEAAEPVSTVLRNYRRDGTPFWNHVEVTPITDDDGTVTHFVGFQHDVTELKERERELAARQRRFETLHDASRELMNADSSTEVARIATDAAKHTLGYPITTLRFADEADGILRTAVATEESIAEAGERPNYRIDGDTPAARVYRTGEPLIYDELDETDDGYDRGDLRTGMYIPVGDYGVMSIGDTDPAAFDDTDLEIAGVLAKLVAGAVSRLESERAIQRRNERLERFANIVAHDLRNPLGIARGRLELARETRDSDDLDAVARAHDRMAALIDDLLTLAREGGTVTDEDAEALDLARIARDCWQHVETLDADLRVVGTRTVLADEGRLRRLLENLFRNSVEHGSTDSRPAAGDSVEHGSTNSRSETDDSVEHGSTDSRPAAGDSVEHGSTNSRSETDDGVTVTVGVLGDFARGATAAADGESRSGFYVADDGVGIPAERRDQVFDDGYSTLPSGTGFGLSIVREIADAHGWSVEIVDSPDGGARFEFRGVEGARQGPNATES